MTTEAIRKTAIVKPNGHGCPVIGKPSPTGAISITRRPFVTERAAEVTITRKSVTITKM
ncbi:hypothetical protein [Nonomuraea terrae]|uniref:hypothetical protein n=1 Tax=Nonomuraea terrae TaxID=2530383 RepID=UPI001404B5B2|nr:hypothetical protein [Nonomuraea terrae]